LATDRGRVWEESAKDTNNKQQIQKEKRKEESLRNPFRDGYDKVVRRRSKFQSLLPLERLIFVAGEEGFNRFGGIIRSY
jgi:hypothetical protein